jgi:phosphoribosylanthranilate isomerase
VREAQGITRIKFCGMTRGDDAAYARELGASYVGVIFTESPRKVSVDSARAVFEAAGRVLGHVAVFGDESADEIVTGATESGADIVQLHCRRGVSDVEALRKTFSGKIWAVISVEPNSDSLQDDAARMADVADALLLDTRVGGRSGGTGTPFSWDRFSDAIERLRERTQLVVAGGLTPENVRDAIGFLAPDIVDVSSGVEISPGVKDPARMKAFAEAVRSASIVEREIPPPLKVE